MKNKNTRSNISFLLYLVACFLLNNPLAAQENLRQEVIDVFDKLLIPDNIDKNLGKVFSYSESKGFFSKKRKIEYTQRNTKYGTDDKEESVYEYLCQRLLKMVPDAKGATYITPSMWNFIIDSYCAGADYFLTTGSHDSGSKNKALTIDWGNDHGNEGGMPRRLAIMVVCKEVLEKHITEQKRALTLFSKDKIATSSLLRFLWPNWGDLSKMMSFSRILQSQIDNEIDVYLKVMSPKKLKKLANKARNYPNDTYTEWTEEELKKQINIEINNMRGEVLGKDQAKRKKQGGFFSGWLFKGLIIAVIAIASFSIYIVTLGDKDNANSTGGASDDDQFNDDDDEFEEEE